MRPVELNHTCHPIFERGNIFGISDAVAIGALRALRAASREVSPNVRPRAGFDDIPTGRDVSPALTTVRVPLHNVGYQAFQAAFDDQWEQGDDTLRLEVLLRDSSPPRNLTRHRLGTSLGSIGAAGIAAELSSRIPRPTRPR